MKKGLIVAALALTLVGMEACVARRDSTAYRTVPVTKSRETLLAEKRERLEIERVRTAERRRIEFDERYRANPYYTNSAGTVVYNKTEVEPAYYGGQTAMAEYLRENLSYPKDAFDQGEEGTIFVDFVVLSNGQINEVYVMDVPGEPKINQSLREEAVRVVLDMPNWVPGRQNGEAVDVRYSLPITFRIG